MWHQCFLTIFLLLPRVRTQEEGSVCSNPDGAIGICKSMPNCPIGLKMLRTRGSHDLLRCGFKKLDEIICCPDTIETITTTSTTKKPATRPQTRGQLNTRKSIVACEAFMNSSITRLSWHIINGLDAAEGEFPHMAALGYLTEEGMSWDCGGALIAPRFVLTAGHCIYKVDQILPTKVRMGTIDLTNENDPNKQDFDVEDYKVHPQYKRKERLNDIAILKLKTKAKFTEHVQPACLYTENNNPKSLTITGWGVINSAMNRSWQVLQKASIYESSLRDCKEVYKTRVNKQITESHICAADRSTVNTSDTCQGDSGGPLQVENLKDSSLFSIVGVTSYGMGCGTNFPSIYTRVSAYLDFIEGYVWPD